MAQRLNVCLQWGRPGFDSWVGKTPGEGNGNPLQYSCLENPMEGGAWWATIHGVAKSRTRLSDFTVRYTVSQRGHQIIMCHFSFSSGQYYPQSVLCWYLLPPQFIVQFLVLWSCKWASLLPINLLLQNWSSASWEVYFILYFIPCHISIVYSIA